MCCSRAEILVDQFAHSLHTVENNKHSNVDTYQYYENNLMIRLKSMIFLLCMLLNAAYAVVDIKGKSSVSEIVL